MTETLWLAGLLIANLWAAGGFDANNTEKEGRPYRGEIIRTEYGPPILSQIPYVGRRLFATVGYACNDGGTMEPALKHGERTSCETPPTREEVMRELPALAAGVPFVYEQYREEIEFTAEKIVDRVDDPCYFPLLGMAQMHRCRWKCVVSYTDVVETANPFPFKARTKHTEVVFIEKNQFQVCGDEKKEGAAEAPQSCPAGQFRPMVKEIVKAEPEKQVLLEITVASIDRDNIPDATYRWAKKQLGLGEGVGVSVPKNGAASELVEALQKDGFVKVIAMPRLVTLSGNPVSAAPGCDLNQQFGINIAVLPIVKAGGKIHLELSKFNYVYSFNGVVPNAMLRSRAAQISAALDGGETVVIGGLTHTETTETDVGVPVLAELPIVGALFGGKQQLKTERDLLILVRARIVEPGDAAETSEPPLSSPKLAPFPTIDNGRKVYVVVDGGPDGQQVSVVRFEGQSLLELIGELDEVRADNVKEICVTRRTSAYVDAGIGLPIDWKQLTQSGRCGVELMAGDRVNILLEPVEESRATPVQERRPTDEQLIPLPPCTEYCYPDQTFERKGVLERTFESFLLANAPKVLSKALDDALPLASRPTVGIDDVVKMSKAGVSPKIIVRQIELTNAVFNLTPADIIALHQQGVSKRIISAIQERRDLSTTLDQPLPLAKYATRGYPDAAFDRPVAPRKVSGDKTWFAPFSGPGGQTEESETKNANTAVTEMAVMWHDQLQVVEGAPGKSLPGVVGRVYLGIDEAKAKKMVEADGCIHVEMYDVVSGAKLSEWRFDAETLKSVKRADFIGMGYTLFLPWEGYRPEITRVEMRAVYMPENVGQPQHAAPQVVHLRTTAGRNAVPALDFGFPIIRERGQGQQQLFSFWSGLFR